MTRPTSVAVASSLAVAIVAAVLVSQHRAAAGDDIEVKLCDNQTTTTVPADQPVTHENGEKIAKALMDQWKRAHPDSKAWVEEERAKHTIVDPADNSALWKTVEPSTTSLTVSSFHVATSWAEICP